MTGSEQKGDVIAGVQIVIVDELALRTRYKKNKRSAVSLALESKLPPIIEYIIGLEISVFVLSDHLLGAAGVKKPGGKSKTPYAPSHYTLLKMVLGPWLQDGRLIGRQLGGYRGYATGPGDDLKIVALNPEASAEEKEAPEENRLPVEEENAETREAASRRKRQGAA
jgi:hypothetical protein